jgi:hypothetical protein
MNVSFYASAVTAGPRVRKPIFKPHQNWAARDPECELSRLRTSGRPSGRDLMPAYRG